MEMEMDGDRDAGTGLRPSRHRDTVRTFDHGDLYKNTNRARYTIENFIEVTLLHVSVTEPSLLKRLEPCHCPISYGSRIDLEWQGRQFGADKPHI